MLWRTGEIEELEPCTLFEDKDFTPVAPPAPDPVSTSGEKLPDSDTPEKGICLGQALSGNATSPLPSSNSAAAVPPGVQPRKNPERLRSAPKRLDL
ncbi:unnamed protein product [Merluccius merluccius]